MVRRVGGEANVADAPRALPLFCLGKTGHRPFQLLRGIDTMDGEDVHVVQVQQRHGLLEGVRELLHALIGLHLRLHQYLVARQGGKYLAQLVLARAVAARRLDVVYPELHRTPNAGFQIRLVFLRDGVRILPRLLIAHATAADDGNLKFSLAETTVLHLVVPVLRKSCPRQSDGDSILQIEREQEKSCALISRSLLLHP